MTLTRSLAHNTALQIVGKIISTIFGLVAIGIMTRTLGTEEFGWYATAAGWLQFIGILSDFGFTLVVSNLLSEPRFAKQTVLNTTFTWRMITAVLFQGLAPLVFLFFPYPTTVKLAVFIITFSFLAVAVGNVFLGYFRAELNMLSATIAEVVGRLVLVGGIAGVAYLGAGFLAMMAIISLAALTTTAILMAKSSAVRFAIDRAVSRAMFHKMWPTAVAIIFNAFYLQGDRVLLPLYVSASEVGFYGAAYRVVDVVIQVAAIVMGLVMPLITFAWSRGLKDKFREHFQLGFDLLSVILLPMLTGIFVLATPIMIFVAGPTYAAAGPILRWLAVCIFGICFGQVFGHVALAINRQKEALWIYVSDAVISVAGYLIFIPRFGIPGAIGVTIGSELYAGFGLLALTVYYSKTAPRLLTFGKIAIVSGLMGATLWRLPGLSLGGAIMAGGLIFLVGAMLLKIISPAIIREILRWRPVAPNIKV